VKQVNRFAKLSAMDTLDALTELSQRGDIGSLVFGHYSNSEDPVGSFITALIDIANNACVRALNKLTVNINATSLSNFGIAQCCARRTIRTYLSWPLEANRLL
jgi:hypothetical protein